MMKLVKFIEDMKRLLIPRYTDKKVNKIQEETTQILRESAEVSERYNKLLKKNGVTMRIAIAAGHGDRSSH